MKRLLLLFFFFSITANLFSQMPPPLPLYQDAKIIFNYDNAGNQTIKYFKYVYAKSLQETTDSTQIKTGLNLIKNESLSQLEYYPNPIEDDLTINWVKSINSHVVSLQVYSIDYKLLISIEPNKGVTQYNIQFNTYANGIYIVRALFNNGTQDTFKVIKK